MTGHRDGVADRLASTELLYRFAELMDEGDFDRVGELLGRGTFGGEQGSVSGASAITKLFFTTTRRYRETGGTPRTRHLVLNPIVEIHADGAAARSTFCVVQATDQLPLQPIVVGRYLDTFGRDEQGWYFSSRRVDVEMIGDVSAHLLMDPGTLGG